jgi:sugar lactone lactonase YvrE
MRSWLGRLAGVVVLAMVGCAAPPVKERFALFYPPAPELPRLQWLTSFTTAQDVEKPPSAFQRFVLGEEKVVRRLDKPYGVAIHDGRIYVCDTNRGVMVFDLKKRSFGRLAGAEGGGALLQPVNVFVEQNGTTYVSDPARGQVVVFDAKDRFVKAFGAPAEWRPVDAVAYGDELYVADIKNGAVVVLDKQSGRLVRRIGREGQPVENLFMPTNLAFGPDGALYVSDTGKFGILTYGRDGTFRGSIGRLGTTPGTFARPKGVAVDRQGRLYAVDAAFANVQIFNADGRLLLWFGHFGKTGLDPGDLFLPAKVAIDYDNIGYFTSLAAPGFEIQYLVLVTSQFGDNMVNVYGFGRQKGLTYPSDEELEGKLRQMFQQAPPAAPPAQPLEQQPRQPDQPATPAEPAQPAEPAARERQPGVGAP